MVLCSLIECIPLQDAIEKELFDALRELAEPLCRPVSSFDSQLLQSGIVEGLLQFATDPNRVCKSFKGCRVGHCIDICFPSVDLTERRKEILLEMFGGRRPKGSALWSRCYRKASLKCNLLMLPPWLRGMAVHLTRYPPFYICTYMPIPVSKRSLPSLSSLPTCQLCLGLVAGDGSDVPHSLPFNINIISIGT